MSLDVAGQESQPPVLTPVSRPGSEARRARRESLRQLSRSKTLLVGVTMVGFWVFCALVGDRLTPEDPLEQSDVVLGPPSREHWFGTDQLGRDILSRVLAGASDTLEVAPLATLLGIVAGTAVGPRDRVLRWVRRRCREQVDRRSARAAVDRDRGHGTRRARQLQLRP